MPGHAHGGKIRGGSGEPFPSREICSRIDPSRAAEAEEHASEVSGHLGGNLLHAQKSCQHPPALGGFGIPTECSCTVPHAGRGSSL